MGWKSSEIARFWKYEQAADGTWRDRRQSMTETLIPRGLRAGVELLPMTRIQRLEWAGAHAVCAHGRTAYDGGPARRIRICFDQVFLCAGAVHTPLVLLRSGISRNIGRSLRLHPMVRIAVRYPERFNNPSFGVPVVQIEEFKPRLTLGGSHSSIPHIAMWMGPVPDKLRRLHDWETMAVFYVAAVGEGSGVIQNIPGIDQPFIRYNLPPGDLALLGEGLYRLGQMAFAAGAVEIFNPIAGGAPITHPEGLSGMRTGLPADRINVTTIHLFSSCPMGEDRRTCAVDSWGRLHGFDNIWLNDASILPLSPAVNPQGTVLAVARRNALRFLGG
jgi:hypothetical protein